MGSHCENNTARLLIRPQGDRRVTLLARVSTCKKKRKKKLTSLPYPDGTDRAGGHGWTKTILYTTTTTTTTTAAAAVVPIFPLSITEGKYTLSFVGWGVLSSLELLLRTVSLGGGGTLSCAEGLLRFSLGLLGGELTTSNTGCDSAMSVYIIFSWTARCSRELLVINLAFSVNNTTRCYWSVLPCASLRVLVVRTGGGGESVGGVGGRGAVCMLWHVNIDFFCMS